MPTAFIGLRCVKLEMGVLDGRRFVAADGMVVNIERSAFFRSLASISTMSFALDNVADVAAAVDGCCSSIPRARDALLAASRQPPCPLRGSHRRRWRQGGQRRGNKQQKKDLDPMTRVAETIRGFPPRERDLSPAAHLCPCSQDDCFSFDVRENMMRFRFRVLKMLPSGKLVNAECRRRSGGVSNSSQACSADAVAPDRLLAMQSPAQRSCPHSPHAQPQPRTRSASLLLRRRQRRVYQSRRRDTLHYRGSSPHTDRWSMATSLGIGDIGNTTVPPYNSLGLHSLGGIDLAKGCMCE